MQTLHIRRLSQSSRQQLSQGRNDVLVLEKPMGGAEQIRTWHRRGILEADKDTLHTNTKSFVVLQLLCLAGAQPGNASISTSGGISHPSSWRFVDMLDFRR